MIYYERSNLKKSDNNPEILDSSVNDLSQKYTVSIKFKEGVNARLTSNNKLETVSDSNVSSVEKIVDKYSVKLESAFGEPEEKLLSEMESLKPIATEVPNLSSYYTIHTDEKKTANDLVKELSAEETIESVEIVPVGEEPNAQLLTPSFADKQSYCGPSPDGIDIFYALQFTGSKGDGIKIIDIEQAWNFNHEDLQQNQGGLTGGVISPSIRSRNHGTAVMGVIGGNENNFGITGIVPHCHQSAYSPWDNNGNYSFHIAMKNSADALSPGDIILIEQHARGPDGNGQGQDGYIAMEFWDINFAAIKYATSKGIIVVEAAGNGSRNLDNSIFENKFNRGTRDSGAILVGAGAPPSGNFGPDRSRLAFSNWGNIIDVQGWGAEVVTCGYGDLHNGQESKWYTKEFNGTSSASPIIVGVIACLQGIRKSRGEPLLTFNDIRNLFHTTGSLQQDAPNRPKTQKIGNRPNLKEILDQL